MINISDLFSSLDMGSKKRLKDFTSRLATDYDRRNFDDCIDKLIPRYLKGKWVKEFKVEENYLRHLRSSVDGKLYSQGVKEYAKLLEAGKLFSKPNYTYFGWNRNYKEAKRRLIEEFSMLKLDPLCYSCDDDIITNLPRLDTHAGFTYILTGMKEKGKNLENIFKRYNKKIQRAMEEGSFNTPILPAVRTQGKGNAYDSEGLPTGDCDHKTRMVSMVDLFVIICELQFARPIQDYLAVAKWYAGGKDLDYDIANNIYSKRQKHQFWVSLDYSSFDQTISAWLIHDAFEIIRSSFHNLSADESKLLSIVEHDFIEKDFVFKDEIIHSVRGVPSGSMFTQIIDSIVNRLVVDTYMLKESMSWDLLIMGDDNLVYTNTKVDVHHLSSYILKNFGLIINPDKTKSGNTYTNPVFLSCIWMPEGRYREPHELIGKLLYPERKRIYADGRAKPEEVLWSYVLMYPIAMKQILNIPKLLKEYPKISRMSLEDMDSRYIPGAMRYLMYYSRGSWLARLKGASTYAGV